MCASATKRKKKKNETDYAERYEIYIQCSGLKIAFTFLRHWMRFLQIGGGWYFPSSIVEDEKMCVQDENEKYFGSY